MFVFIAPDIIHGLSFKLRIEIERKQSFQLYFWYDTVTDEIAISKFVNRTKYCNTNLSDTCTALPSINNLATTVTFPVNYGTLVSVGCNTGNTLSGDSSITCEKDTAFVYTDEPVCNQRK